MAKSKALRKTRVLIIQAGRAWTARVKEKLGPDGYSFTSKPRLADAIKLIKTRPFDVVIFDADLVAVDCKGACIKIDDIAPGMPKIVLAMTGEEAMKAKSCCSEAQDYLAWNHTSKKLLQRSIRQAIENHERQQTLRREHDFNAAIFDNMGGVAAVFDAKGRFVRINRAFKNVLGYSEADVLGKSARSFLARKRDIKTTAECLSKIFSKGISKNCETLWKTGTGGRRLISWSHSPLTDDGGDIRNIVCTGIDVTEQKQSEEILRTIAEGVSGALGRTFFQSLVVYLATALNTDYAFIGELTGKRGKKVRTIAVCAKGARGDNFEYNLAGTPCRQVMSREMCYYGKDVREKFPKDVILKDMKINGYLGTALKNSEGVPIGIMVVLKETPLEEPEKIQALLRIFAVRAAAELERCRTEDALRESEERFSRFFHASPVMLAITTLKDGVYHEVNESWIKVMGFKRREVIGKKVVNLNAWVDQEERNKIIKLIKNGKPVRNHEVSRRIKNGDIRKLLISVEPIMIKGKQNLLWAGADITERKKTEAALRDSEEMFAKAFNANPGLIVIVDAETDECCDVNKTFLSTMGFSRKEVIGKTSLDLKLWDDPEKRNAFIKAFEKNGFIKNHEERLRTKKGKERDILFSGETIKLGGKSCFLLSGIDITDRKKARKALKKAHDEMEVKVIERTSQLQEVIEEYKQTAQSLRKASEMAEEASRTKTRFLANMSHELRTPLNAILGFSGAMSEKVFGPLGNDKYESYVGNIMESGRHLLELIEDVLDLSKIDAMAMDLNEESVAVPKAVATSMNFISPLAREKNISVKSKINGSLPEIMADPLRVRQILINLLSNAVKFTPNGGKVMIDAKLDANGRMILSVTDTGIGMAAEDIPEALSEFGQLDSTLAREGQGTGLGLPLSRQLMHLHGGSLVIESREGEGTRVDAIFPKTRVLP